MQKKYLNVDISKHKQSFNLLILITHICGQRVIAESYYIANNVYVTMPQAGFDPLGEKWQLCLNIVIALPPKPRRLDNDSS